MRNKEQRVKGDKYFATVDTFSRLLQKKIFLSMTEEHRPITFKSKEVYKIEMPSIFIYPLTTTYDEHYSLLEHEISHIMFDSPFDSIAQLASKTKFPFVARNVINVLEDYRVESLYGQIYRGTWKHFLDVQKRIAEYANFDKTITGAMLAIIGNISIKNTKFNPIEKDIRKSLSSVFLANSAATKLAFLELWKKLEPFIEEEHEQKKKQRESSESSEDKGSVPSTGSEETSEEEQEQTEQDSNTDDNSNEQESEEKEEVVCINPTLPNSIDDDEESILEAESEYAINEAQEGNFQDKSNVPFTEEDSIEQAKEDAKNKISEIKERLQTFEEKESSKNFSMAKGRVIFMKPKGYPESIPVLPITTPLENEFKRIKRKKMMMHDSEGIELDIERAIDYTITKYDNRIYEAETITFGFNIGLLIDLSGSMAGNELKKAKSMLLTLYNSLKDIDSVTLNMWGFSGHHKRHMLGLTEIKDEFDIRSLSIDSKFILTPLHMAIPIVTDKMRDLSGKKVVIVLTDGCPAQVSNSGKYISERALIGWCSQRVEDAQKNGIPYFCFAVGVYEEEKLEKMFGSKYFILDDMETASSEIVKFVSRQVCKYLIM